MKQCRPAVCLLACIVVFISACQKQPGRADKSSRTTAAAVYEPHTVTAIPEPNNVAAVPAGQPQITFEKTVHDFGLISPSTVVVCEFTFKNTGSALLKIEDTHAPCGCTTPQLEKTEYPPGQSGTITVKYRASRKPHADTKHVYINTNDPANPKTTLTIQAKIVNQVSIEPEKLKLSLRQPNAACPDITLTSIDSNLPFAIRRIESTGDCITVDFNSDVKATHFVLQPKVDIEKLRQNFNLEGVLFIDITHPNCPSANIPFRADSEFRVQPSVVTVLNAEPNVPVSKQLTVHNLYGEPFELESANSRFGHTKIQQQTKDPNGACVLTLLITPPPPPRDRKHMFTDVINIKIKNGESFRVNCRGFYTKPPP